jgi:uncharacterized FlaG/YvyC family protein
VSAVNGIGFDDLLKAVDKGTEEYTEIFLPEIKQRIAFNEAQKKQFEDVNMDAFQNDKKESEDDKKEESIDLENLYKDFDSLLKDVNTKTEFS